MTGDKNTKDKKSDDAQYDRARDRAPYRPDEEERENRDRPEGTYGGVDRDELSKDAEKATQDKSQGQNADEPKNTGRGAASRHQGDKHEKRSDE